MRLFASFREAVGQSVVEVEAPEGLTVSSLLDMLAARYPALDRLIRQAMVAVNMEYVGPDFRLHANDEVALIPPVSGGAGGPV